MIERVKEVLKPDKNTIKKSLSTITLPFDKRHCRRKKMIDDKGNSFLLDLQNAKFLHDGERLLLESGEFILICAALEEVADINCFSALDSCRVAWHIGNRHVPLQVLGNGKLRILRDDVLIKMVQSLGASIDLKKRKFQPEGGAYINKFSHAH